MSEQRERRVLLVSDTFETTSTPSLLDNSVLSADVGIVSILIGIRLRFVLEIRMQNPRKALKAESKENIELEFRKTACRRSADNISWDIGSNLDTILLTKPRYLNFIHSSQTDKIHSHQKIS